MYPAQPDSPDFTLAADVTTVGQTAIVFTSLVGLLAAPNTLTMRVDDSDTTPETMYYAVDPVGTTLTVTRGYGGTVAKTFIAGALACRAHTSHDHNTIRSNILDLASSITPVPAFETDPTNIKINGTQGLGSSGKLPNSDHVHPTDTSRAATTQPIDDFGVCGTTDTTKDANTTNHGLLLKAVAPASTFMRFVGLTFGETIYALKELFAATTPSMDGSASAGVALTAARIDHIHPSDTSRAPIASPTFTGTVTAPTVDIGAGNIDGVTLAATDPLKFGLTPTVPGTVDVGMIYWKATEVTPTIQLRTDVALPLGQKDFRRVYNPSASDTIPRGAAVYTLGVGGTPTIASVGLAQANASSTAFALGLTAEAIAPLSSGFVVVRGHVGELDTSAYDGAAGDVLYLSATTPGAVTSIAPSAPDLHVRVGRLIVKNVNGKVNVRSQQIYALNDLTDVSVPAPVASQLLKFDGVSWVAADSATVSSAGGTDFYPTGNHAVQIEGLLSSGVVTIVTATGHGMETGAYIFFFGITTPAAWAVLNGATTTPITPKPHVITYIDVDHISIAVNSSAFAAYVPASDAGTYAFGKLQSVPDVTIPTQTDSADSTGNVEVLMSSFTTAAPLGRTSITAGEWVFKTWCYASSNTDVNTVVIVVSKMSAIGTRTELFRVATADLTTVNVLSQISTIQGAYAVLATDRLVIAYYAKSDRGGGSYRTLFMTHNGTTNYSYVKTPLSLGHASLGQLQYADAGHVGFAPSTALGAWAAFSPTPTWGTADPTITTTVARYARTGNIVSFNVSFVISNGNAASSLVVALPVAAPQTANYQLPLIAFKKITTGGNSIMSDPFAYIDYTEVTPTIKFNQFGTLPTGYTAVLNISGTYEVA
jgi:hypothetical protein